MKKVHFLPIVCLLMLAMAFIPNALCYPPAGLCYLNPTTAIINLQTGIFNETFVQGPTNITRGTPYDPGDGHIRINTKITYMHLTGNTYHNNIGPITIVQNPSKTSNGTVRQVNAGVDFPANCSFDLYVEIHTMLPFPLGTLHNDDPTFMTALISSIPPPTGTVLAGPPAPVPLKNQHNSTIGFITMVRYIVGSGPCSLCGGLSSSPDALRATTSYFGLISIIAAATVATGSYAKRVNRGKEKQ
jgi:hypothetical protein